MSELIFFAIYGIIALGFFVAMITESRKHEADITWVNLLVAVAWPVWLAWYSAVLIRDWWRARGNKV